jgi:hypothetical protein
MKILVDSKKSVILASGVLSLPQLRDNRIQPVIRFG